MTFWKYILGFIEYVSHEYTGSDVSSSRVPKHKTLLLQTITTHVYSAYFFCISSVCSSCLLTASTCGDASFPSFSCTDSDIGRSSLSRAVLNSLGNFV